MIAVRERGLVSILPNGKRRGKLISALHSYWHNSLACPSVLQLLSANSVAVFGMLVKQ
jgi:hypothetical protein